MVHDPIPQSLPVHFLGSRPQAPTSWQEATARATQRGRRHLIFVQIYMWNVYYIYTLYKYIYTYIYIYIYIYTYVYVHVYIYMYTEWHIIARQQATVRATRRATWAATAKGQPIADRVAQNLEIISKHFLFSTRRTRIFMGFITSTIYYVVLIINPMGRILVRWFFFEKYSRDYVPPYLQSAVYICI